MSTALKILLARLLPPESLFWLRSVKRAIMGETPLNRQTTLGAPRPSVQPRTMQSAAIEKLDAGQISAPYLFFGVDDILVEPAKDIARALTFGVLYVNSADVKGDIAEFGTMGGFTARSIAAAMVFDPRHQPYSPLRRLRLFDSFEGLPEITSTIDLDSPHVISGTWSKGGCKVLGAHELRTMVEGILPPERVEIAEGWFADTLKALPSDTRFAMIHFDGDLYQSTIDALEPCFERGFVSKGAVICFDDWNCNQSDPAYGERRAWAELVERFGIAASHGGDYSIGGTKFLIHSYRGISLQ
jgi:O-methyltransferase